MERWGWKDKWSSFLKMSMASTNRCFRVKSSTRESHGKMGLWRRESRESKKRDANEIVGEDLVLVLEEEKEEEKKEREGRNRGGMEEVVFFNKSSVFTSFCLCCRRDWMHGAVGV